MINLPKAAVFIEGSNIYFAQKKAGIWLDWLKVKHFLGSKYRIGSIRYYVGVRKRDPKMRSFLKKLKKIGFKVVTKPVKIIKDESGRELEKANFDVEITADILQSPSAGIVILFTGDSDFAYLVKVLHKKGRKVVVFSSRKTLSWELKLSTDKYIFVEDLRELTKKISFARLR